MSTHIIANCVFILVGAAIMLVSIVKAKGLVDATPFVPQRNRERVRLYLLLHRGLMVIFFVGYVVVTGAFALRLPFISETLISVIFLLGALFVFTGIAVQSRLLAEVQQTIQGILPICTKCKKIRATDANPQDPTTWKKIEVYISEKVAVDFSHGYCPTCFEEEMKKLDGAEGKT
jgi:small-conductance mechanosensitive channel